MNDTHSRPQFRKLFIEFTVIVTGVLVALVAESWWSEREDRRYEAELREDMVAEFRDNIRILEEDIASNEEAAQKFAAITQLSDEALQALTNEYLTGEYGTWINWAGFDPELGSVQALVDSGNVAYISERELRLQLSRWAGLLKEKVRFTAQATDVTLMGVAFSSADYAADLQWTPEERRQLQANYKSLELLHSFVMANQRRLLDAARGIHEYLATE